MCGRGKARQPDCTHSGHLSATISLAWSLDACECGAALEECLLVVVFVCKSDLIFETYAEGRIELQRLVHKLCE